MRKVGAEVVSGMAIFLAILIFIFGFLFLKNTAFKRGYHLYVHFADVTGLEPHDVVNLSGLKIGQVEDFELRGLDVVVRISIDETVKLPRDSRAHIKNLGLVGEKFIDIAPGTATEFVQDGDFLEGVSTGDLTNLTDSMEEVLNNGQQLLTRFLETFDEVFDPATRKNLKESLAHLNQLSATLDHNAGNFEALLVNLESASKTIDGILTQRRREIESSIENLYTATGKLEGLMARLDSSMVSLSSVLAKIDSEQGTVGKVIASDELYNNIRQLQAQIDELLRDLKKYPQKYVNLRVF